MCKSVKLYQMGSEFIKKIKTIIGSFSCMVMNYPMYSKQGEVIKELESLMSQI